MKTNFKGVPPPTLHPVNSGALPVRLSGIDEAVTLAKAAGSKSGGGKGGVKAPPGGPLVNLPGAGTRPPIVKGGGVTTGGTNDWTGGLSGPNSTYGGAGVIDKTGDTLGNLFGQTVDAIGGAVSQLIPQQVADWFGMDAEDLAPPPAANSGGSILPLVIIGGLILFLVFKG